MRKKYIENWNNETKQEESRTYTVCDDNNRWYFTEDGLSICYEHWDDKDKRWVAEFETLGNSSIAITLKESYHEEELNDRYQQEMQDPLLESKQRSHDADSNGDEDVNPWDKLGDRRTSPEEILFEEPEPENPDAVRVRQVIDDDCTEAQQNLFYDHFGSGIQLEEIRQTEAAQTGKLPSASAMTNRKNKIVDKAAKALGVERVKRHKYPKKD
ncbi:MAG: hypothetical protein LIO99_07145 [Clostridiales bacterium]|nr:hypothetical protein [Clostridiales bacterium]